MKKFFYRVNEGESVLSVSGKFNVSTAKLIKDNNLKSELYPGQLLYVERTEKNVYVVKPTDTLSGIARRFGVSEEEILEKNKVKYLFYPLVLCI